MSKKNIKVLVAGATGYIGGGVVQMLHKKGYWVRALVRDKSRLRNEEWCDDIFVGHATKAETLEGLCDDIDIVFSSIGIRSYDRKPTIWEVDYQANINILEEAKKAGSVKNFLFITVVNGKEMAKLSPIAKAREMVADAIKDSGINYTIFAPTGFFNDMKEFIDAIEKKGVIKVFGDGTGKLNPLSSLDLGEEIIKAIEDPENPRFKNKVLSVGGPDIFKHREIAEMAFRIMGKEPKIKHIKPWKIKILASIFRIFNYNLYALFKFFEYCARTSDMTGEPIGKHKLEDFYKEISKGKTLDEVEAKNDVTEIELTV